MSLKVKKKYQFTCKTVKYILKINISSDLVKIALEFENKLSFA